MSIGSLCVSGSPHNMGFRELLLLWNGLPDDIKRANNICHFKKLLKPFVALM